MTATTIRIAAAIVGTVSLVALIAVVRVIIRHRRALKMSDREIYDDMRADGYPVTWRDE